MKGLFPVRLGKANSPSDSQRIDMLSNNEKLIAVVGATGQQGGAVVRALMFVHVTGAAFPEGDLALLPDGPSEEERAANRAKAVAEATRADGSVACTMIDTVSGHFYTSLAAVEAASCPVKHSA